jgi:CheY-like chemotaxis protein
MMMVIDAGGRVLVVEDDERVRGALCDYLEELGYTTEAAANGPEALARFATTEYRLVVADYRMPGLTGLDVVRQIRSRAPGLPVIIVSGYTREFEWQARDLGIPVIPKPVDFGVFARIVEGLAASGPGSPP